MRKLGGNDVLEMWGLPKDGVPHIYHVDRQALDQRAKWTLQLIQSWGMAAAFGDILPEHDGHKHKTVPPQELAMRACEVVDAAWNEMRHRGWVIDLPPFDEVAGG